MNIYLSSGLLSEANLQLMLSPQHPASSLFVYQSLTPIDQILKIRLALHNIQIIPNLSQINLSGINILIYSDMLPLSLTLNHFHKIFRISALSLPISHAQLPTNTFNCKSLEEAFALSPLSVEEIEFRKGVQMLIENNLERQKRMIQVEKAGLLAERYLEKRSKEIEQGVVKEMGLLKRVVQFQRRRRLGALQRGFNGWVVGYLEESIRIQEEMIHSNKVQITQMCSQIL